MQRKSDEPSDAERWMDKEDEAKEEHKGDKRLLDEGLDGAKEGGQPPYLERAPGSN